MKVYVVVEIWKGLVEEMPPTVYLSNKDAQKHVDEFVPDNYEHEIHLFETEIIKPRMVLAAHRRAMARLEALCS